MTERSKHALRSLLRQRRRVLSPEVQAKAGQDVAKQVFSLPEWNSIRRIAIYHSSDGEISTEAIAQYCHQLEIEVYLPVLGSSKSMVFAQWQAGDELQQNRFGIYEPPTNAPRCPLARFDIVFLPLVGWDKSGGRLGMGGGYYDRALFRVSGPLRVGLAHEGQEIDTLPRDSWDIPLDAIITNTQIYRCR